jgi:hypothetical protein
MARINEKVSWLLALLAALVASALAALLLTPRFLRSVIVHKRKKKKNSADSGDDSGDSADSGDGTKGKKGKGKKKTKGTYYYSFEGKDGAQVACRPGKPKAGKTVAVSNKMYKKYKGHRIDVYRDGNVICNNCIIEDTCEACNKDQHIDMFQKNKGGGKYDGDKPVTYSIGGKHKDNRCEW